MFNVLLDPDFPLLPNLDSSTLILSFHLIPNPVVYCQADSNPVCLLSTFSVSNLAAAFSFYMRLIGHCHLQPETNPQRLPLTSSPNLQLPLTSIILNIPWQVLLVVSFTVPLGFRFLLKSFSFIGGHYIQLLYTKIAKANTKLTLRA